MSVSGSSEVGWLTNPRRVPLRNSILSKVGASIKPEGSSLVISVSGEKSLLSLLERLMLLKLATSTTDFPPSAIGHLLWHPLRHAVYLSARHERPASSHSATKRSTQDTLLCTSGA